MIQKSQKKTIFTRGIFRWKSQKWARVIFENAFSKMTRGSFLQPRNDVIWSSRVRPLNATANEKETSTQSTQRHTTSAAPQPWPLILALIMNPAPPPVGLPAYAPAYAPPGAPRWGVIPEGVDPWNQPPIPRTDLLAIHKQRAAAERAAEERAAAETAPAASQSEDPEVAPLAAVDDAARQAGAQDQDGKKKGSRRKSAGGKKGKENAANTGEESKGKAKKWTPADRVILCRAYKKATETPEGAGIPTSQYWENVAKYYNQIAPEGTFKRDGVSRACTGLRRY